MKPSPSRRSFLKKAALASGAVALSGCAPSARAKREAIKWRVPTLWDAGTVGFTTFQKFCESIKPMTDGQLEFEAMTSQAVTRGQFQLFDAVKEGKCEAINGATANWAHRLPVAAFLASYPLGLDRPDQWETWYYELGGLQLARRAYEAEGLFFVGPIQHDMNIIHSKVPIRSFEELKGKRMRFPGGIVAEVFQEAGASTVILPGAEVYAAMEKGTIDAADFVGPAVNYNLGFGNIAKYIIMGPRSTPCLHQAADLLELTVRLDRWRELSKPLQDIVVAAVRQYSWDHYSTIQRENIAAWEKFEKMGVEIIRLTEADVHKLRKLAIPVWFKWARKDALTREAFASQLRFMRSQSVGYISEDMLVDRDGRALEL
ncbi:MAG: TRAP transporter substrate-binding protein DctP [Deltaproteobacteria bacterium]|nr:TRAP transporter substrate-binding protein DctP [Deltaproteobacteria bacterium]